jgi:hypothetical protein
MAPSRLLVVVILEYRSSTSILLTKNDKVCNLSIANLPSGTNRCVYHPNEIVAKKMIPLSAISFFIMIALCGNIVFGRLLNLITWKKIFPVVVFLRLLHRIFSVGN